jgi:hypothetical protein
VDADTGLRSEAGQIVKMDAFEWRPHSQWAPIESGLLRQPVSSHSTIRTIDTVGYNFGVIDAMIGRMRYF